MSDREAFNEAHRRLAPLVESMTPEQAFAFGWIFGLASRALPPREEKP